MRNAEIALHFDELADLYELDGAIVHRVLAYRNAAKSIREATASVEEMTRAGTVTRLPGVGKTIEEKLTTLFDTGTIPSAEKLKAKYPPGLVEVTRLPGFGHRVHATIDPRVDVLFGLAADAGLAGDGIRFARALEGALRDRLKPIPLNIDGALAAILVDIGLPSMLGKLIFIVGRVAGLSAEVLEEHTREKPMRIKIPVTYDGAPPRQDD